MTVVEKPKSLQESRIRLVAVFSAEAPPILERATPYHSDSQGGQKNRYLQGDIQ